MEDTAKVNTKLAQLISDEGGLWFAVYNTNYLKDTRDNSVVELKTFIRKENGIVRDFSFEDFKIK